MSAMKQWAVAAVVLVVILLLCRFKSCFGRGGAERYGPPPGWYRALSHEELDDRGWPEWDKVYEGSSAASVSHMVERSA